MSVMTRADLATSRYRALDAIQTGIEVVSLEAVDQVRQRPARDKQREDAIAERAEVTVQIRDRIPEGAVKLKLTRDQSKRLDAADHQCHQHRYRGNGQIVEQFAHRVAVRPAIGTQHQHAVSGVDQRHAGGEQRGENQQRPTGYRIRRLCREPEQTDLARGLEAESKQQANRIKMPALRNKAEERFENSREPAALMQQRI